MTQFVKGRRKGFLSAIFAVSILAAVPGWGAPPNQKSGPDLRLTMTDSPDPVLIGNDLTYAITVKNLGPSGATGVTVTDTLPATVSFVSSNSSRGSCTGTATVTCNLGSLAKNATATVNIVVRPAERGSINNTASVKSEQNDPKPADNSATVSTTVNEPPPPPGPTADLAITMTDSPDPAAVGGELTYSITVTNKGPSQATGITVTDQLPASVDLLSATAMPGSCSGTTEVTCDLGTMEMGWDRRVTIKVQPKLSGSITNIASVGANEPDPTLTNNSVSAVTTIQSANTATADLKVNFNYPSTTAIAGATIFYTVSVQNIGAATAKRVQLQYPLPAGAILQYADVDSPNEGNCLGDSVLTCNVMDLPSGAFTWIRIRIKAEQLGTISNTLTVSTTTPESATSNNSAVATTQIQTFTPVEASDIAVTATQAPDPTVSKGFVTYAIDVRNLGPNDSGSWTLGGSLPSSTSVIAVSSSKGTCRVPGLIYRSTFGFVGSTPIDIDGTAFSCVLGTLKNGESVKASLTLQVNRPGTIRMHFEASLNCFISCLPARDPELRNNYQRLTTNVGALGEGADLWIGKLDHIVPWVEPYGDRHTFQTTVINGGASAATSVTLTEQLPEGSVLLGVVPSQGSCSGVLTITCDFGQLAADGMAMVTIVVRPPKGSEGANVLLNEGHVSSSTPDPDPTNNRAALVRPYISRAICVPCVP